MEGYSELVSNTETTFAGNPLKAAKRKRLLSKEKVNNSNMYELIGTFKGNTEALMTKINDKMRRTVKGSNIMNKSQNSSVIIRRRDPESKKPVKARKGLNVVRLKIVKQ